MMIGGGAGARAGLTLVAPVMAVVMAAVAMGLVAAALVVGFLVGAALVAAGFAAVADFAAEVLGPERYRGFLTRADVQRAVCSQARAIYPYPIPASLPTFTSVFEYI